MNKIEQLIDAVLRTDKDKMVAIQVPKDKNKPYTTAYEDPEDEQKNLRKESVVEETIDEIMEDISKTQFKKKKRKRLIRQRRHVRQSPAQKRGLKKARKKAHTGSAKRKAKRTKKVRGRKGIYNSMDAMIDIMIESVCSECGSEKVDGKCPSCEGTTKGKGIIIPVLPGGLSTGVVTNLTEDIDSSVKKFGSTLKKLLTAYVKLLAAENPALVFGKIKPKSKVHAPDNASADVSVEVGKGDISLYGYVDAEGQASYAGTSGKVQMRVTGFNQVSHWSQPIETMDLSGLTAQKIKDIFDADIKKTLKKDITMAQALGK